MSKAKFSATKRGGSASGGKQTEIGDIPEGWVNGSLEDIADFKNGKSSPLRNGRFSFPVFGSNGMIGYSEDFNSEVGTVVIGRVGSYCGSVYYSQDKCWVTDNAIIGRVKGQWNSEFLYYLLLSLNLNRHRAGSGQPLLNQEILNSIEVTFPVSCDDQRAIAKILSDLDEKIELNHQMNKTLESLAQAIFKHWFVDFEFPDEHDEPYKSSGGKMVDSELGDIPQGWEIVANISEICDKINYGYTQSASVEVVGPKFLRVTDINKGDWVDWSNVPFCEISEEDASKYILQKGDIVIARMADPGKLAIFESDLKAVFASYLIRLRIKDSQCAYYLYYLMKSPYYQNYILGASTGSVQKSLNARGLTNGLPVVIPKREILQKFNLIVGSVRQKISNNVSENIRLSLIRDSLLPRLISGKIRINEYTNGRN